MNRLMLNWTRTLPSWRGAGWVAGSTIMREPVPCAAADPATMIAADNVAKNLNGDQLRHSNLGL